MWPAHPAARDHLACCGDVVTAPVTDDLRDTLDRFDGASTDGDGRRPSPRPWKSGNDFIDLASTPASVRV